MVRLILICILILLLTYLIFNISKFEISNSIDPRLFLWKNGVSIQSKQLDISRSPTMTNPPVFPTSGPCNYTLSIDIYIANKLLTSNGQFGGYISIIDNGLADGGGNVRSPHIELGPNTNKLFVQHGRLSDNYGAGIGPIPFGVWFNITIVVTPSSLTTYLNGVQNDIRNYNYIYSKDNSWKWGFSNNAGGILSNNQPPGTISVKNAYYWLKVLDIKDINILSGDYIIPSVINIASSGVISGSVSSTTSPSFISSGVLFNSSNKEYLNYSSILWNIGTIGFSINIDITFTKINTWMRIVDINNGVPGGVNNIYLGCGGGSNHIIFGICLNTAHNWQYAECPDTISINVPYKIVAIYNPSIGAGGQMQVWINDKLSITTNPAAKFSDTTYLNTYIGKSNYPNDPYLAAKIKVLNIFNYPINPFMKIPDTQALTFARYVKIQQQGGPNECMNLMDIMVYSTPGGPNIALGKTATASSIYSDLGPNKLIDGNTDSIFHSACTEPPWALIDLIVPYVVSDIIIYNRRDGCSSRVVGNIVTLLDSNKGIVYKSNPLPDVNGGKALIGGCGGPSGWFKYSMSIPSPIVKGSNY